MNTYPLLRYKGKEFTYLIENEKVINIEIGGNGIDFFDTIKENEAAQVLLGMPEYQNIEDIPKEEILETIELFELVENNC